MLTRKELIAIAAEVELVESDLGRKAGAVSEAAASRGLLDLQLALIKTRLRLLNEANINTVTKPAAVAKPIKTKVVKGVAPTKAVKAVPGAVPVKENT